MLFKPSANTGAARPCDGASESRRRPLKDPPWWPRRRTTSQWLLTRYLYFRSQSKSKNQRVDHQMKVSSWPYFVRLSSAYSFKIFVGQENRQDSPTIESGDLCSSWKIKCAVAGASTEASSVFFQSLSQITYKKGKFRSFWLALIHFTIDFLCLPISLPVFTLQHHTNMPSSVHQSSRHNGDSRYDQLPFDEGQSFLPPTQRKTCVSRLKSIGFQWPKGCQGGVTNALILDIFILIVNIAVAGWLAINGGFTRELVIFQRRSCQTSTKIIIMIHLIINVLAALLLAASNYCMQILISPRREEVNLAHAAKKWLWIGVPNLTNLLHIPRTRRFTFLTLAVSSLPIHLIWNSAITQEIATNTYLLAAVSENFFSGASVDFNASSFLLQDDFYDAYDAQTFEIEWYKPMQQDPTNLTVAECLAYYSRPFISDYSNLALAMNSYKSSNSILGVWTCTVNGLNSLSSDWPCSIDSILGSREWSARECNLAELPKSNATYWNPLVTDLPYEFSVSYCLAQKTDHICHIGFIPFIVWIVLLVNVFKVICFGYTLLVVRRASKPLVTIGDMIQSFILEPDPNLNHRCLVSISQIRKRSKFWTVSEMPLKWLPKRQCWLRGAFLSLWLLLFLPAIIGLSFVIVLYVNNDLNRYLNLGFSSSNLSEIVKRVDSTINHGLMGSVLLTNTPQIILSYIYTAYNAVLTSMLSHAELLGYSTKQRGLRVTEPAGAQRSSYYLSLPYRFSIPLIIASALLHWLISQSIFMIRVNVYTPSGTEDRDQFISTVGFSAYAIVIALVMAFLMLFAALGLGFAMKYPATMPLTATCSASIAAICQPAWGARFEPDTTTMPLMWSSITHSTNHAVKAESVTKGHATFSSSQVSPLIEGAIYEWLWFAMHATKQRRLRLSTFDAKPTLFWIIRPTSAYSIRSRNLFS